MSRHLLLATVLICSSSIVKAEPYVELGFGKNFNFTKCSICWDDAGGIGTLAGAGYNWYPTKAITITAHYLHLSQINRGRPFTKDKESSVDHVGVKLRYSWW